MGGKVTDNLSRALRALRDGQFVVVSDATDREDEADLIVAAERATPERLAFLIRHTSGIVCAPMHGERAEALDLPPMVADNTEPHRTAFTVSVDAAANTTTGISAADRAETLRALAAPTAKPADFVRPGHVFPLRAHPELLRGRQGHTEAAVELMSMAGMTPVAAICELANDDGTVMRGPEVVDFAARHGLVHLGVEEIAAAGPARPGVPAITVEPLAEAALPSRYGDFMIEMLRTLPDGTEHVVLKLGDLDGGGPTPLVRIHSECATGDLFGSRRCDCGEQLRASLREVGASGRGLVLYERGHEGRGIGLVDKLHAYVLQEQGVDTVDANLRLGHPADGRDFRPAAAVLAHLGVTAAVLLTNNPEKLGAVRAAGIDAVARPLRATPHDDNLHYLETKRLRFGHDLPAPRIRGALV
ncbi:MAG: 3,4-dihydroxy-2-butanone-4-phosphate synthase [Solirubrobacterales bacterium]